MRKKTVCLVIGVSSLLFTSHIVAENMPEWVKQNGWVPYENICEALNTMQGSSVDCSEATLVTENASITHWVGEVISMYYSKSKGEFVNTKVKVTWVTDKSPYKCGLIVKMRESEMKNFTHRSIAMKKCS
ncbi:MAG: hypothetical protein V3U87_11200 [Methylococcaceae bacterium]